MRGGRSGLGGGDLDGWVIGFRGFRRVGREFKRVGGSSDGRVAESFFV